MGNRNAKGFTLIEMAVVLVIIGLLFAGVVLAQSLIRSSNVQTIISDVAMYQSAISQFKQKYNEMPGDMTDATNNWGTNPHCSTNGVGTGTQTCNGNGNGRVDLKLLIAPFEQFLVWQHLANGGFISGQYSGTSWPAGSPYHVVYCSPGNNCPGGRVNQSQAYFLAYSTGSFGLLGSTANYWAQGLGITWELVWPAPQAAIQPIHCLPRRKRFRLTARSMTDCRGRVYGKVLKRPAAPDTCQTVSFKAVPQARRATVLSRPRPPLFIIRPTATPCPPARLQSG
jgi:prepilin-type N-terminal cleavage/methylation domain-containing protein